MKWFMSYVQVYQVERYSFGHTVYAGDEHPVAKVERWNATHGQKDGFTIAVQWFAQVGDDVPEVDMLTRAV